MTSAPNFLPSSLAERLGALPEAERREAIESLTAEDAEGLLYEWRRFWARPNQIAPDGDWTYWLLLAGRGYGKTRTAVEWVRERVEAGARRLLLAGPTTQDVRDVMVEGESGILAKSPPWARPHYEPSKRRLTWPNGARALLLSADEPERFRGQQCLVGGTPVLLANGSRVPIEHVRVGDAVATRVGSRRIEWSGITRRSAEVYRLQAVGGRAIVGTADHHVWIDGVGFTPLHLVRPGTLACVVDVSSGAGERATGRTLASAGTSALSLSTERIASVERLPTPADVYDITVTGAHEFFADGILVHNSDTFWAEELAAWRYPDAWDQMQLGCRLGSKYGVSPRGIISTTPKPTLLIRQLVKDERSVVTGGSTYENAANLAPTFISTIISRYEGTRLGRQELYAELLEDVEGALWTRAVIERARVKKMPDAFFRVVVAIDPAVTATETSDETGIIVAGYGSDRHLYVLADISGRMTPNEWARKAIGAFDEWNADRIVAEENQGGKLVEHNLRTVRRDVPYVGVRATQGKRVRAEPVAALYEQKKVHHVGGFPKLEDQMCLWEPLSGDRSPDRLDALVWAMSELAFTPVGRRALGPLNDPSLDQ